MFDEYGDGLYASQWGNYQDGSAGVYGMDGANQVDIVFEYDGASGIQFGELSVGMEATTVAGIDEANFGGDSELCLQPNQRCHQRRVQHHCHGHGHSGSVQLDW